MAINTSKYRRPLVVYVAWHPGSAEGKEMAGQIYAHLCHDVASSSQRGLGIPVFFRSAAARGEAKMPLPVSLADNDPNTAKRTAVVVLVDNTMLLDRGAWGMLFVEILRGAYFPDRVESLRQLYRLKGELQARVHAPELLTALDLKGRSASKGVLVYPDPPLATGELELIRKLNPNIKLATPATISTM